MTVSTSLAQQHLSRLPNPVATIYWNKQKGVKKYRLQIASDEAFNDVRFDGPVIGERYLVRGLPPGRYYWRIAPSGVQARQYRKPVAFLMPGTVSDITRVAENIERRVSTIDSGWLAATGDVAAPVPALLQTGSTSDFIGVNSEGTVYALDGSKGVALWTARYRSNPFSKTRIPPLPFRPLVTKARNGSSIVPIVMVAYDGGVRALNGTTGKEIWRTRLSGSATAGVVSAANSPASRVYLIVANTSESALVVLNTSSGRIEAQTKLAGPVVNNGTGSPILFGNRNSQNILVPLRGDGIAVYDRGGQLLRTVRTGADITAAPIIVQTLRRQLMLVGTMKGLAVFSTGGDGADFELVQYIGLGNGQPVNSLSSADVDSNGIPEVLAITRDGRISLVDLDLMTARWAVNSFAVASDAGNVAFADVDHDGRLDILLPGKDDFAIALSGNDGSVIWRSPMPTVSRAMVKSKTHFRSLAVTTLSTGRLMLVGSDVASGGLRAIEVTPTKVMSNVR